MIEYHVSDKERAHLRPAPPACNGSADRGTNGHVTNGCHAHNTACVGKTDLSAAVVLRLEEVLERFGKEAERGVCDTGRYRAPFYVWGSGPPLVFVHGLCDDARSFVMPIARLSEHFRCIAYDLPAGREDGAQLSGYRHDHFASDLLAILDHLGLKKTFVLGSSFGSTIALKALHRQPRRFRRAILQGGFAHRPLARAEVLLASWARYWPWPMRWLPLRLHMLRHAHFGHFEPHGPELWQFFLDRDGGNPMNAVARRALLLHQTDLRHLLKGIRHPVLLVCGDGDPLVGKKCENDLLQSLPHAVRVEIQRCGHMPHFTHPEVLAELVRGFCL